MQHIRKKIREILLGGLILTALTSMASASALVSWELKSVSPEGDPLNAWNSNTNSTVDAATFATTAAGATATDIKTTGLYLVANNGGGTMSATNSSTVLTKQDLVATGLTDKYTSFTLTATEGNQLTFDNLDFSSYRISGSSGYPDKGVWGYRIDSGEWVLSDEITLVAKAATGSPVALYNWDFDNFTTTGMVEFAFWGYGSTSGSPNANRSVGVVAVSTIGGAGMAVNGSVSAVPEPSTYAMLLAGIAVLLWQVKRQRNLA